MLPAIALQRAATAARGGGRRQGALVVGLAPEARQGGVVGVVQRGPTIARSPTRRCLSVATAATPPSLAALPPDLRADVGRALELAERAAAGWSLTHTDFLPPPAAAAALGALRQLADVAGVAWGGFAGAERVRLTVGRRDLVEAVTPEALASDPDAGGVAALAVRGRFTFDPATHRDFLGAALGSAGLNRRVVGDVVVQGEKGATLFVAPTAVEALEVSLTQVRGVRVETRATPLADLDLGLSQAKPAVAIRSVEASLRLDALASAGFRISRAAAGDAARRGDLRLNWLPAKRAANVAPGDVLSCAGRGRVEVVSAELTSKGRWAVQMVRYA